jgi:hypothetical protein
MIYESKETKKRIMADLETISQEFILKKIDVMADYLTLESTMYYQEMHKTGKQGLHLFEDYLPDMVIKKLYENYTKKTVGGL